MENETARSGLIPKNRKSCWKQLIGFILLIMITGFTLGYMAGESKAARFEQQLADQEIYIQELQKFNDANGVYLEELKSENEDLKGQISDLNEKIKRILTISESGSKKIKAVGMAEARGSSLQDMMGVMQTVYNRSTLWNAGSNEILSAPGQYATPYKGETSEKAEFAFELVYLDGYMPFSEPTTHFCSDEVSPYWTENKIQRGKIDRHFYYY